jgi:hypothetical protein
MTLYSVLGVAGSLTNATAAGIVLLMTASKMLAIAHNCRTRAGICCCKISQIQEG